MRRHVWFAGIVGFAVLSAGCFLDRSGSNPNLEPGMDAGPGGGASDAATSDSGAGGGTDGGFDGGFDSAVPVEDGCVPQPETCDNTDEDCDGFIDNALTRPCTTACGNGTETCTLGRWRCSAPTPTDEVCDGMDNDCDGTIDNFSESCDEGCGLGSRTCLVGAWGPCSLVPETEVCDNVDNDCDTMVDEDVVRSCIGPCGNTGTEVCRTGSFMTCNALTPVETCNGIDDDCDGIIDDGAGCPCTQRYLGTQAYLFCTSPDDWTGARTFCRSVGYELITINDLAEHNFALQGLMDVDDDWWIGMNDRGTEGVWVWDFGLSTFTRWGFEEPGNFSADSYDCGVIENGSASFEDREFWADNECDESHPFFCESR